MNRNRLLAIGAVLVALQIAISAVLFRSGEPLAVFAGAVGLAGAFVATLAGSIAWAAGRR